MKYKIQKAQLGLKVLSEKSDNTQVNNIRRPVQKIKYNYVPMSYSNRMKLQAQKYKDDNSLFSGSRLLDRTKELGKVIKTPVATLAASATAIASPTIAARLLTGSTSAVGFGQLGMGSGNSLHDAAYGMAGEAVAPLVGKVIDKGIGAIKSVGKSSVELLNKNVFKSEIDWGKWNKEIPQNKKLLNEYNEIEKSAKESGNWMKNPDGSNFKGTPEQFVQQQSSNFKKAFPNPILDDSNNIQINYHGSRNKLIGNKFNQKYSNQHGQVYGSGIYTSPSKEFANDYATRTPKGKMYELYINSNNPQKPIPPEYNVNININDAVLKPGYDFLKSGSEQIIPFSNYPKSAIGNNGMFNMTNPNIYKTITGISAGLGALKLNKQ